ncbi:hypothetical protein [Endozoicomonas sp. ONNA1]|uniref:hypothetical protein n=1 Tax=Endozoicomonas sp. ONNA1 TaxID=2828740 RepID=UPI002148E047|nr:hypothetical protein [Endozoicomonas sp. ONNA1]
MARLKDATLAEGASFNDADTTAAMVDLEHGGQNGFHVLPDEYVSSANYVPRNLIAILVEPPRGYSELPNGQKMIATLKALIEEHPKVIEGLTSTLTSEFAETPVGGAGEMQEDLTNVTRARTVPSFTWPEKYGRAIGSFWDYHTLTFMMDPETKVPRIMNMADVEVQDLLPDFTGFTCLFFEPDPTHRKVISGKAWLVTNMHPKSAGENTARRELAAAGAPQDITIEFTAFTQVGRGVTAMAQKILDDMNLTGVNPNNREALVTSIAADVAAAGSGYQEAIREANSTYIQ